MSVLGLRAQQGLGASVWSGVSKKPHPLGVHVQAGPCLALLPHPAAALLRSPVGRLSAEGKLPPPDSGALQEVWGQGGAEGSPGAAQS